MDIFSYFDFEGYLLADPNSCSASLIGRVNCGRDDRVYIIGGNNSDKGLGLKDGEGEPCLTNFLELWETIIHIDSVSRWRIILKLISFLPVLYLFWLIFYQLASKLPNQWWFLWYTQESRLGRSCWIGFQSFDTKGVVSVARRKGLGTSRSPIEEDWRNSWRLLSIFQCMYGLDKFHCG